MSFEREYEMAVEVNAQDRAVLSVADQASPSRTVDGNLLQTSENPAGGVERQMEAILAAGARAQSSVQRFGR
jgi:hypothetical protein